jgi:hypothetical protein
MSGEGQDRGPRDPNTGKLHGIEALTGSGQHGGATVYAVSVVVERRGLLERHQIFPDAVEFAAAQALAALGT